jgi:hypothetical protein
MSRLDWCLADVLMFQVDLWSVRGEFSRGLGIADILAYPAAQLFIERATAGLGGAILAKKRHPWSVRCAGVSNVLRSGRRRGRAMRRMYRRARSRSYKGRRDTG